MAEQMHDPGPGFRAELMAALDILMPEITGLEDLSSAGLSGDITKHIQSALQFRDERRGLIRDVINALNVVLEKWGLLRAHGYPNLPHLTVSDELNAELQKERIALEAAFSIFGAKLRASQIKVNLSEAVPKS